MEWELKRRGALFALGAGFAGAAVSLRRLVVGSHETIEPATWSQPHADPGNTAAIDRDGPGDLTEVGWSKRFHPGLHLGVARTADSLLVASSRGLTAVDPATGTFRFDEARYKESDFSSITTAESSSDTNDAGTNSENTTLYFTWPIGAWTVGNSPRVVGEQCYCITNGSESTFNGLSVFDSESGKLLWGVELEDTPELFSVFGTTLVVADRRTLIGIDVSSGTERWSRSDLSQELLPVAADGERILTMDSARFGNRLVSLDPNTGEQQWETNLLVREEDQDERQWDERIGEWEAENPVHISDGMSSWRGAVYRDDRVYTTVGETLLAVDATNGNLQWVAEGTDRRLDGLAVLDSVFVTDPGTGSVRCFDRSGDQRWKRSLFGLDYDDDESESGISVCQDAVYVATEAGLWTLDPDDGSTRAVIEQELEGDLSPPQIDEDGVSIVDEEKLYRFRKGDHS